MNCKRWLNLVLNYEYFDYQKNVEGFDGGQKEMVGRENYFADIMMEGFDGGHTGMRDLCPYMQRMDGEREREYRRGTKYRINHG